MSGLRFALLARTSTKEMQDHDSSLAWQRAKAETPIRGHGEIVRIAHDVGVSRSFPWKRRPQSAGLLDAITGRTANFDAIVVGELARGFGSPEQATEVLAVLDHFNIDFWSYELSGPYGYNLVNAGVHPNPAKARDGKHLRRLAIDPIAAPIVQTIYSMYVNDRRGLKAIAQKLTDNGVPSPSAHDPERNKHRQGNGGAWSQGAIRSILMNPTYTGRMAWGRTRGEERLVDWADVSQGRTKKMRWLDQSEWVFAEKPTHEAIIDPELFAAASDQREQGRARRAERRPATKRAYVMRGKIRCSSCGRKMEADTCGGRVRYRCRLSTAEYARNEELDRTHPRSATVGERRIVETINPWLSRLFDPDHAEETIRALTAVADHDPIVDARVAQAERKVADADAKLGRYREALDSGADPVVIGQWIAEVRADRAEAQTKLAEVGLRPPEGMGLCVSEDSPAQTHTNHWRLELGFNARDSGIAP